MRLAESKFRRARFGVFEADLELHELRKLGVRIKLTGQPFQALGLLLEHSGDVVTREDLRQALWPNEPCGEHDQRLNKIVNKIREALSDSAETPRYLETIPRVGYRFLVNVELFGDAKQPEAPPLAPVAESPMPAADMPAVPIPSPRRVLWTWITGGALFTAAILAVTVASRVPARVPAKIKIVEPAPLTTYVGSELYPALSPDGKSIAFAWDGDSRGGYHIYTAPVSGSGARQITDGAASDGAPVWSPDGSQIAFLRDTGPAKAELWVIQADGQAARKLREVRGTVSDRSVCWTKDPNWLVVSQPSPQNGVPSLFLLSARTGEEHQITSSSSGQSGGDLSPAISPDGKRLAFTRSTSPAWRDIFVVNLSKDQVPASEPFRLTDAHTIVDHVAWTPDGHSIVFSAATTIAGSRHLYRVNIATDQARSEVVELGIEGDHPTVAGTPFKLAFVRKNIEQSSVWRLELDHASAQPRQSRMISSTRRDYTTDLSPDGVHIVFSSVRSGPSEIWMSEANGSNLQRLTSVGGSTPRWSPDGKQVAFESNHRGQSDIYVLTVQSGEVRRVTSDGAANKRPSWSRDGRFIYFGSDRTGRMQIWKVPSAGGDAVQITRHGGLYAVETFDARSIYYTSPDQPSEIWTTSPNGGDETRVLPNVAGYSTIAMARDGLYYLSTMNDRGAQLDFYRFGDRTSRALATIDHPVHRFLSSSPDGKSVVYSQVDRSDSDLMIVDPFR
jgi:Tol biopolymer transport system component/DNA-binding winged helix-turn-helix (wHTH) protein